MTVTVKAIGGPMARVAVTYEPFPEKKKTSLTADNQTNRGTNRETPKVELLGHHNPAQTYQDAFLHGA